MLTSCDELIQFSPYDADVSERNINANQISLIDIKDLGDTLRFAIISDTHNFYDELSDAIKSINKHDNLDFVLCNGDITQLGLEHEFEWYNQLTSKLDFPLITLIGNHDYRSNGKIIYEKMYGPSNFTFQVWQYKFVMFDDIYWENNNQNLKLNWLRNELSDTLHRNIVVTHIPYWTDQLEGTNELMLNLISTPDNTILNLHGHLHRFNDTINNGIRTVLTASVEHHSYTLVQMVGDSAIIKNEKF